MESHQNFTALLFPLKFIILLEFTFMCGVRYSASFMFSTQISNDPKISIKKKGIMAVTQMNMYVRVCFLLFLLHHFPICPPVHSKPRGLYYCRLITRFSNFIFFQHDLGYSLGFVFLHILEIHHTDTHRHTCVHDGVLIRVVLHL